MKSLFLKLLVVVASLSIVITFQNCSKPVFTDASALKGNGTSGVDDATDSIPTSPTPPPTPTPGDDGGQIAYKLEFKIVVCPAGTVCAVDVRVQPALPAGQSLIFDWYTNDDAYKSSSDPKVGVPNINYTPETHKNVTLTGGSYKTLTVQSLGTKEFNIPFIVSNCSLNNEVQDCGSLMKK